MLLSKIFNHKFDYDEFHLYDRNGNEIYFEDPFEYWVKYKYDNNNNLIYLEDSFGYIKDNYKRK